MIFIHSGYGINVTPIFPVQSLRGPTGHRRPPVEARSLPVAVTAPTRDPPGSSCAAAAPRRPACRLAAAAVTTRCAGTSAGPLRQQRRGSRRGGASGCRARQKEYIGQTVSDVGMQQMWLLHPTLPLRMTRRVGWDTQAAGVMLTFNLLLSDCEFFSVIKQS